MNIYHKEHDGWFICGCGYTSVTQDDIHLSKVLVGYCNNGMKCVSDNKYQCVCGKIFDNMNDSRKHVFSGFCLEKAHKVSLYTCNICDIECHSKYYLEKHNKTQRHLDKINQPLLCKSCDVRCSSQTKYDEHLKTKKHLARLESPPLDLECKICNIKCLSQKQMKSHLETKKHVKNESTLLI